MTDDETNDEFEQMLERMADENVSLTVEVCEIAEPVASVEITVPISVYEHPEVTLFTTIAAYLRSIPRRAVVALNISYEIRSHNMPHLIGTLFLTDLPQ